MATQTTAASLSAPLTLANGAVLPNRIAKAAMSEQLGDLRSGAPTGALETLYRHWSAGGLGLTITGNVMIDARSIGEPRNVIVEDDRHLDGLARWAAAARTGGTQAIVQLNHPGRQTPTGLSARVVAPSAIPVAIKGAFPTPRALTHAEILELIERFATTARIVCAAGFDGVQIHGAHGYLISQFLSPKANVRTDDWGGDPERRRRFLLEVAAAIRAEIGPEKILALKLNSADFQRGGFSEEESLAVIAELEAAGIHLLEISGGTYEAPAMAGTLADSTRAREAYFLEFAEQVRAVSSVPLMVTGGFRSGAAMQAALTAGAVDVIGLARPLALEPDLPRRLLAAPDRTRSQFALHTIGIRALDAAADLMWTQHQIHRLSDGKAPDPVYGPWRATLEALLGTGINTFRRRRG